MAPRETLGRLVLLEETGASALGREFRAARLGPGGLERLVSIVRFEAGDLVGRRGDGPDHRAGPARLAGPPPGPRPGHRGIARVEQSLCLTTELVEGRSLAAILERCRHEAFPFAADHALMIVSRAAAALESLRGSDRDPGPPSFHGLVAPSRLVVTFEGEVKLTGLGLWAALHGTGLLPDEERRYLAPEQRDGGLGFGALRRLRAGTRAARGARGSGPRRLGGERWPRRRAPDPPGGRAGPPAGAARAPAAPRPGARASRRAVRGRRRHAEGDRRAAVLRRLRPHHVRPGLLHAHALPRRDGARGPGRRGGPPCGLRRPRSR
jgi:hypothetical protein